MRHHISKCDEIFFNHQMSLTFIFYRLTDHKMAYSNLSWWKQEKPRRTIMFELSCMIFGGHFELCCVVFIMTDWLEFCLCVFFAAILNYNFSLLDSDLFVGLMLYQCLWRWPNIKTTLRRRFIFDGITTVSSIWKFSIWKVLLSISKTQCWLNACLPPSATLAPHETLLYIYVF